MATDGVILFSLFAGAAWLWSAQVKVSAPLDERGEKVAFMFAITDDSKGYELIADGINVGKTLPLQSKWNRRAALFACGAAICQFLQTILNTCACT
jgi:hypothetical protein